MEETRPPTGQDQVQEGRSPGQGLGALTGEVRRKIHSFALGSTLALGVIAAGHLGQSCALSGG